MKKNIAGLVERLELLKNGQSATAFAAKCKIPQAMMDRYLKGENLPSAEKIILICVACECSSDWLLGLSSDADNTKPCSGNTKNLPPTTKLIAGLRTFRKEMEAGIARANTFLESINKLEAKLGGGE